MEIVKFKEHNIVFGEGQFEYQPLPAFHDQTDPTGKIVCCWKLSLIERVKVLFTGIVWHEILTFRRPLQPQMLHIHKPEVLKRWETPAETTSPSSPSSQTPTT